jgi:fatty-acyl-CoA synthase
MTEAMAISTLGPPAHRNPKLLTTVGLPLPVVQLGIRDPRTGEDLPAGQSGEICVRSPFLMDGYWRDPEATAQTLRGGWLHTGDIGYLDDEGYLHLVDRLARMIKTRGVKVYPATIEDVLLAQPTVAQAAVYRAVDTDQVEHVYAAVEPRRGATIDPAELRVQVERKLSATHAPVRIIVLDALPLLDSGKPDERRLRFEAEIAAGWRLPTEAACVDPL